MTQRLPILMTDALATRRKRAKYRAWHRGTKEMDLILGRYGDAHLDDMAAAELAAFEALMDVPDQTLYGWIVKGEPVTDAPYAPLLERIMSFNDRHAGRFQR